MRELFILIAHLLVTLAKLGTRGGLGAVAAESLAVKHQLLIMKRAQRRAPKLTSWDRLVLGVCALLVSPKRLSKMAVILKPSTLLCFHHALVKRKYRLLYSPRKRRRPGPKGPSKELIGVVIEMKRRNPRFGCRKIAEQISKAFAVEINKDIVRRILIQHYRPVPGGDGPSWLTVIGHAKDSLWSVDFFRSDGRLHPPHHRLWHRGGESRRYRHLPDVQSRDREEDTAAVPLFRSRSIVSLSSVARESSCA
jgi:putative transposase